jgi:hypothetical protein
MSKKLLFSKLFLSFALCIAFATSCDRSKEIAPVSEVPTPSVTRNDKNGSQSLYEIATQNIHLRSTVRTILQINTNIHTLSTNYTQQQLNDGATIANNALTADSFPTNPLNFIGYDANLYETQLAYLSQEITAFHNDVPAFQKAESSLKMSIIDRIVSDLTLENPNDPIYVVHSYRACVMDAAQKLITESFDCGTDPSCHARAMARCAFRVYLCRWLN